MGAGSDALIRLLVILAACGYCAQARLLHGDDSAVLAGPIQLVSEHNHWAEDAALAAKHVDYMIIKTKDQGGIKLLFPQELPYLPETGTYVIARTMGLQNCVAKGAALPKGKVACVKSMMANEAAPVDNFAYGQPRGAITFKPVIFILQVCNKQPATTPEQLQKVLFSDVEGAQQYTLQGLFSSCSRGKASFRRENTHIVPNPIPVPCTSSSPYFDSQTCPYGEWSDYVMDYATKRLGMDMSAYTHKIFVLMAGRDASQGPTCPWGGLGYTGCTQNDCRVWINGEVWQQPQAYFHELGHNLYLDHAGKPHADTSSQDYAYGDWSGAMGLCCDMRCYNTPHLHQLGWASPVATLHKDNFPGGKWLSYTLPATITAERSFLRVRPDWYKSSAGNDFWLAFRKKLGYDGGLRTTGGFANKVMVYSTKAVNPHQSPSMLEKSVGPGERWIDNRFGSNFVVRVTGIVGNEAYVRVCRKTEASERTCNDGLDNDCDGNTDGMDTSCQGVAVSR